MLTPIVNLKCINDPTYNKLITIDILNMKLVIINNDDNIDTGDTIELKQPLTQTDYDIEYKNRECKTEIKADVNISQEEIFTDKSYIEKIISRERYSDIVHTDKYHVVETATMISVYPEELHIVCNIFETMFFTNKTEELIRNPIKARKIIPVVITNIETERSLKNKNIEYRYTTYNGKTYLLETNFYKVMNEIYNDFIQQELERLMDKDLKYTICEKMQNSFYNRHRTNLKQLAKKKYNTENINFEALSDLNIVFDLSMFDYLSYSMAYTLGAALDSTTRNDYKYASFILNQNQINCLKKMNNYDDRLINKRINESRIIIKQHESKRI